MKKIHINIFQPQSTTIKSILAESITQSICHFIFSPAI